MARMPVPREAVLQHVEKMLASAAFAGAVRSRALLTFVVQEVLDGRAGRLKEYTIGAEALERGDGFDPRTDPIVRAEASRLRARLDRYYATDGATDAIVISLPKGSYAPEFAHREPAPSLLPAVLAGGADRRDGVAGPATASRRPRWPVALGVGAGACLALLAAEMWKHVAPVDRSVESVRFEVELTRGPQTFGSDFGPDIAISPDGRRTAFVVRGADGHLRLMRRDVDASAAQDLPDTAGARAPFFSPDGQWVGFWANGTVKKVAIDGGAPVDLAPAVDFGGACWFGEAIVATIDRTLVRIPASGGAPLVVADLSEDDISFGWPDVLPGGTHALVTAIGSRRPPSIVAIDLKDGTRTTVVANGTFARWLGTGQLLYASQGTLFAARFDARARVVRGTAVPVLEDVESASTFGVAQFAVSRTGTLVYRQSTGRGQVVTEWVDPDGTRTPYGGGDIHGGPPPPPPPVGASRTAGFFTFPRLSPDGLRLALATGNGGTARIAVYDAALDRLDTLPPAPTSVSPVWTPDGRALVFGTAQGLRWVRLDDPSHLGVLTAHAGVQVPWSLTRDGRRLAYAQISPTTGFDLFTIPISTQGAALVAGRPEVFLQTTAFETYPAFSPDGRWIAYGSGRYGMWDVYVRPFPSGPGREVRVSDAGGRIAHWLPNGRLAYRTDDHRVMVVDYTVRDGTFVAGRPRQWIGTRLANTGVLANFDVSADGRRVIALMPAAPPDQEQSRNHATVILRFDADVTRRLRAHADAVGAS